MSLTPATPEDLDAVVELVNAAYRDGSGRGWTTESAYLEGPRTDRAALELDLARAPGARLLLWRGDAAGALLGTVWLEPAGGGAWYLGLLSVRPELQAAGLGRAVLEAAEAWAVREGARRMLMTVVNVREALIAWYRRRGYALTGETRPFPYEDDRFGRPLRPDLQFVVLEKALAA